MRLNHTTILNPKERNLITKQTNGEALKIISSKKLNSVFYAVFNEKLICKFMPFDESGAMVL
jgi:hypothetical protein